MDRVLLDVGAGAGSSLLPERWRSNEWRYVRLDVDPASGAEVIGSVTDMHTIPSAMVDAVMASHVLEHLWAHEVPRALAEILRVLKPGGELLAGVPDLRAIAAAIVEGGPETVVYEAPAGPIAALDMLYGHRASIAAGSPAMAHRTGFDEATLSAAITAAGFAPPQVDRDVNGLWALAAKPA